MLTELCASDEESQANWTTFVVLCNDLFPVDGLLLLFQCVSKGHSGSGRLIHEVASAEFSVCRL